MDTRSVLQAKLTKAFEDGEYELYGILQEQLKNLPAEPDPSHALVEEEPLTFEAKLRAVSSMLEKSLAVGRETMQVNRDHGHVIPPALLSRMIETKKWQKKIDATLTTRKGPLFEHFTKNTRQVCDKCPAMLDDVKPEHWANLLMKNTAVCYCSSESCGFFCLECEKKVHCEKITGSDETLGETSGHRTFRFDTKAASLKSMDCSSLFDATRACNDWVTKLKDRQKKILELGTQLSSLSEEVENTTKHWCTVDDMDWHPDYPHADAPPSKETSYSFAFCQSIRNLRVTAVISQTLQSVGLGRNLRHSVQLIFEFHGGDVRCKDGVIAETDLRRGFRKIKPVARGRRHSAPLSPGMPPLTPGMHTLIAKGFDKLASGNIRELKQIKIMLVGMVNAGKSSFLNVLLGLDKEIHFPTNESSWTRIITKLKYGPAKKWCLRTTDEKEQSVTEQCDSRALDALCAYGRNKYNTRPKWLQQCTTEVGDAILSKLTAGDDAAKQEVQQQYSVSDADMDLTMQWINGDTHVSVEDAEALAEVSLCADFRDKFFLERQFFLRFTSHPGHSGLLRAQGLYHLREKPRPGRSPVYVNQSGSWIATQGRHGWEFRHWPGSKKKLKLNYCSGCRRQFQHLIRRHTCRYCMRSVCNNCCRSTGKLTRICNKCTTLIKNIRGKLSCEARPPKVNWIAIARKKKHRAGDDRFVPPSVKVTYTHTTKVNGVSMPLKKEVVDLYLFEPIKKGTVYVTYSAQAPVDLPQSTIVSMHVEGRLLQVPVPPIRRGETFNFVPTPAMMRGDLLICTEAPTPIGQSSPIDCKWPNGVELSWLDGQKPNMSDADILGYLLQEQQVYVELTFPAPILKSGLVLIDSPGVGEATRQHQKPLTKFVLTEAQKADAFVYVLDAKHGTPTEEDERTLNALLGYRNQTSRLDLEELLDEATPGRRTLNKSSKSAYFIINKIDQVKEQETITHFRSKLCDVLIKNGLIDAEAFKSKTFSLSCKAELQLQQRGQHSTDHFSRFRGEILHQLGLDKKRHVVGAINEFRNKLLQLSDYFNTNRQQAERNFASLPEFNARAGRVATRLQAELIKLKEEWKAKLRPILADLVEKSWGEWGDVRRICKSIGHERIRSFGNIRNLAPHITRDIFQLFASESQKKLKPAVEQLLASMVHKFEETAQKLDQPLLYNQVRTLQQRMVDDFLNLLYSSKEGETSSSWAAITGILVGGIAGVSGVGGIIAGLVTAASVSAVTMNPVGWAVAGILFIAGGTVAAVSGAVLKKKTEISDKNIKAVAKRVKISMLSSQLKGDSQRMCLVDEIVAHCDSTCKQVIDNLAQQFDDMVADHNQHIKMRLKIRDVGDLDNKLRVHIRTLNEMRLEANILAPQVLLANPWFSSTYERPFALCELFDNLSYHQEELYKFATIFDINSDPSVVSPINYAVERRRHSLLKHVESRFEAASAKYEMTRVDLLHNATIRSGFDSKVKILEYRRANGSASFNEKLKDDGIKMRHLADMKRMFLHNSSLEHANMMLLWHGCPPSKIERICNTGCADLATTDAGFFGRGVYCTPEADYAAYYATMHDPVDGEYVMLLNVVVVGVTYVISRKTDYRDPTGAPTQFSRFYFQQKERKFTGGMALESNGYDSHFVAVSKRMFYQADDEHPQFHELVLKEESQVMPFCRVFFRKRKQSAEVAANSGNAGTAAEAKQTS